MRSVRAGATAGLVAVTVLWGATFVVVKDAIVHIPPIEFLVLRFALATVCFVPFLRSRATGLRAALGPGMAAGSMIGIGYLFQTLGLQHTSATRSGFITGLFVVLAPLASALVARKPPNVRGWVAVLLSTAGLYALSGARLDGLNVGDAMTLLTAIAFAFHVAILGRYSSEHDPVLLTALQMAVATVMFVPLSLMFEDPILPRTAPLWGAVVLLGVGASAVAYGVMTWAQRHLSPTRTAVTLTMEPVFAGVTGFLFLGERLTSAGWVGAAAILAAMLLVSVERAP